MKPTLYTTNSLFEKTKAIIRDLNKKHTFRKVLDVPCGAGALSQFLSEELHLDTYASDIDEKKWEYEKIHFQQADLGRKLPYDNESFDLVVCLEGIKHVTDLFTAISEMSRVLKTKGYFVLTIPNDLSMEVKLRYFFDSFVDVDWKHPLVKGSSEDKSFLYVHSLTQLPYLYYFFDKNSLHLESSHTSRLRTKSVLLAILFYPIIFWRTKKSTRNHPVLLKELTSLTWLAGRHNIIVCQKM
jgi:SAM-dependent methyltransferase